MGQDNLQTLDKWKNYEEILKRYDIYVYPRAGTIPSKFDGHERVHLTKAPIMEISSTFIRNAIKENKNVEHFMHPAVWEYVKSTGYYKK